MFSCEFCETVKNTFFHRLPLEGTFAPQKENRKLSDRNDEILGFDRVVIGYGNTGFNFNFLCYCLFSESQFSGIYISYMKL